MSYKVHSSNDEISIKDIVLKVLYLKNLLLSSWIKILLCSIIFGVAFFAKTYLLDKIEYKSELTYIVESNQDGGNSAYSGIASQFGLNLGGGTGGTVFDGENLFELFKSKKMVEEVLLSKVDTGGLAKILFIEYFFKINGLKEKWLESDKSKELVELDFNIDREKFTIKHDSLLYKIQNSVKENLELGLVNEKGSINRIVYKSTNEKFSKIIIEKLIEVVSDFYIQTKTTKTLTTIEKTQAKVDSIKRELASAEFALAKHKDNSYRTIKAQGYLTEMRLTRDVEILNIMYAESVKNLELTSFALMNETPLIQIIDAPKYPLPFDKPSKLKALIIGGFLGGFLACLYILIKQIYRDIMKED